MTLIRESSQERGVRWRTAGVQQTPREADPPLKQISMRRDSDFASEASEQLEATQSTQQGQLVERGGHLRCRVETLNRPENRGRTSGPTGRIQLVPTQRAHDATQKTFFEREAVRRRVFDQREKPSDMPSEDGVARDGAKDDLVLAALVFKLTRHESRVEIQDAPPASRAFDGNAVVHLTGIDHDDVAGLGLDVAEDAPRALGT